MASDDEGSDDDFAPVARKAPAKPKAAAKPAAAKAAAKPAAGAQPMDEDKPSTSTKVWCQCLLSYHSC